MPTQLSDRPWQQLGSDLFEYRCKHYLLIVDYFSRFPEIRLLHDQSTASVITACRDIFARHGIPERFISDNGPQYASKEFRGFARDYGFDHATSSPRYPQGNGLGERTIQTIKKLLQKSPYSGTDFQLALLAFRTSPSHSTGVSPAQLLMGRRLRLPAPNSTRCTHTRNTRYLLGSSAGLGQFLGQDPISFLTRSYTFPDNIFKDISNSVDN